MGLASGLEFIHSLNHAHRDLCPKNTLISQSGDQLIISDFGLVKKVHDTGSYSVSDARGHDQWMSPERILKSHDPKYRVTIDSDTWSMGCLFFFFLTKGGYPFERGLQLHQKIIDGVYSLRRNSTNSLLILK